MTKVLEGLVKKLFGRQAATFLGAIMAIFRRGGGQSSKSVLGMGQQKMFWEWDFFTQDTR